MAMGTATAKLPMKAISAMIDEQSRGLLGLVSASVPNLRRIYRTNQIPATVAMLDTDAAGLAILAQTENGWLIRIALTEPECLDMARTLLAKVRAR